MDFQRLMALSQFDTRGARIEWDTVTVRVNGRIAKAVVFNAPDWVTSSLKPHLDTRYAQRVRLNSPEAYWLESYVLPNGVDEELRQLLDLLTSICSIGRGTDNVDICLTLDLYKVPEDGVDPNEWANTTAGELVNRSKYHSDPHAFNELANMMAEVFSAHPDYKLASRIVSVPGRRASHEGHGERLARAVAAKSGVPYVRTTPTYGDRPPAKEGFVLTSDHVSLPTTVAGQSVVIVDDVYRSGNSMAAVATQARNVGAARVLGLVAAKTLRN